MPVVAPTAAAPALPGPRLVEVAAGSVSMPGGWTGQAAAPAVAAPAAPTGPVAYTDVQAAPAPTGASAPAQPGPTQARKGVSLLSRILGFMPLAAGLTQLVLGLMITRGTVSIAMVPLLGSLPKFIVGGLVASTAMPSLASGVLRMLGKEAPALPGAQGPPPG